MEFLTYLIKSAAIITLFYIVYIVMLRKDTFFTANRHYLLSGIAAAIVLPFVTFTTITFVEIPATELYSYNETNPILFTEVVPETFIIDWWQVAIVIYLVGLLIMTGRFILQIVSLKKLFSSYSSVKKNGFTFIEVTDQIAPFSFFKTIVYNPTLHAPEALKMILEHEKAHAKQWHSVDLLLINILRVLQWANPVVWLYKKDVEANLEFIADYETSQLAPSKKQYQLALVQASSALPVPALTNNFYHSFIKKRIIMLNKSNHTSRNTWKLSIILPLLALFLWSFNTEEIIEYTTIESLSSPASENTNLQFSATSTEAELDAIESYFSKNHPDALLKISNRKRNTAGQLIAFSFKTKFENDKRFNTRFERKPKNNSEENTFETTYHLQYASGGTLLVDEQGKEGVRLKITAENLEIVSQDVTIVPSDFINTTKKENSSEVIKSVKTGEERLKAHKEEISLLEPAQDKKSASEKGVIKRKITKKTTDKELEAMKVSLLEEYGVVLTYATERNRKKEITNIKISYQWDDQKSNFNVNDPDGIDDFYLFLDKDTNHYGFLHSDEHSYSSKRLNESRDELSTRRNELMAERKKLMAEAHAMRGEKLATSKMESKELLEKAKESRKKLMEERKELLEEKRKYVRENYDLNGNRKRTHSAENTIMINKNTTNSELENLVKTLSEKGVKFNFKRIKRNRNNEITSIKVTVNNGKGSEIVKSISSDDGTPIAPFVLEF